jgi:hypothetical protein
LVSAISFDLDLHHCFCLRVRIWLTGQSLRDLNAAAGDDEEIVTATSLTDDVRPSRVEFLRVHPQTKTSIIIVDRWLRFYPFDTLLNKLRGSKRDPLTQGWANGLGLNPHWCL